MDPNASYSTVSSVSLLDRKYLEGGMKLSALYKDPKKQTRLIRETMALRTWHELGHGLPVSVSICAIKLQPKWLLYTVQLSVTR